MNFELTRPIHYGKDGVRYKLKEGQIVNKKFFSKADRHALWKEGSIIESKEEPSTEEPAGVKTPEITDLTVMNVSEAKEFLEAEPHVDMLEKYLDQANAEEFPRKTIIQFIERRVKELTDSPFLS